MVRAEKCLARIVLHGENFERNMSPQISRKQNARKMKCYILEIVHAKFLTISALSGQSMQLDSSRNGSWGLQ